MATIAIKYSDDKPTLVLTPSEARKLYDELNGFFFRVTTDFNTTGSTDGVKPWKPVPDAADEARRRAGLDPAPEYQHFHTNRRVRQLCGRWFYIDDNEPVPDYGIIKTCQVAKGATNDTD